MASGIYKITNLLNNKIYIGRAVNLQKRKTAHFRFTHPEDYSETTIKGEKDMPIHRAMAKSHNKDDFKFEVVEYCPEEELDEKEQYYIQKFNSFVPNGYNIAKGGMTWPHPKGEQHPNAKLTKEQVAEIKTQLKQGVSATELVQKYNASLEAISAINNGYNWRDDNETYPLSRLNGLRHYTSEEILDMREARANGASVKELAKKYNTYTSTISQIVLGKVYKEVGGPLTAGDKPQKNLTEEQVMRYRTEYANTEYTVEQIWENSKLDISYESFNDMIKGRTYKEYPVYYREEKPSLQQQINQRKKEKEIRNQQILKLVNDSNMTMEQIAKTVGCSVRTVYRVVEKDNNAR